MSMMGQAVPRVLGHPLVQAGLLGVGAGTAINYGIDEYIFHGESSIGSELYDLLNPTIAPVNDLLNPTPVGPVNDLLNPGIGPEKL